jgi:5'-nucleotidase
MERPLILVTNDDGITAPGIRNLISFMNEIGEVVVVAPTLPKVVKATLLPLILR